MGINIQAEIFRKWLYENNSLHDAILFELDFADKKNEGDSLTLHVLKLGLKIPVDLASEKYDIVTVILKGVLSADVKIQYSITAQCFLDAIYLTNAEVVDGDASSIDISKEFRLKLYGDYYSELDDEWKECQVLDVLCESFEIR